MKIRTGITAIIVLSFISCTKTYICTTTVTTSSEVFNSINTTDYELKGSKEDAEQYELDNTSTFTIGGTTLVSETICK